TTLYRFQVKRGKQQHTIEMRGDQTLGDLNDAIQRAFGLDFDHLWAFFLSGQAWDSASEYGATPDARIAAFHHLEAMSLTPKQRFLSHYDFGEELGYQVTVEETSPAGVTTGVQYPRIA